VQSLAVIGHLTRDVVAGGAPRIGGAPWYGGRALHALGQEAVLFAKCGEGDRARYLIVYPFTKSTEWYLTSREVRQGSMNEHMRVGHTYPQVRQLLANSFGLDDQDFLVAYETDDLPAFSALVRDLRGTDGRRSTVRDTPILLGVHRPAPEIVELLGASEAE